MSAPQFGHAMLAEWPLDPAITYLNHGTVGVTPRRVLAAQQAIRDDVERQPSRFMLREVADFHYNAQPTTLARPRLRMAADQVGAFVGSRADDLVFVENATSGAGAVLGSLDLREGDELLVNDHGYGAVTKAAQYWARRAGAHVRSVELPYPRFDERAIVEAIMAGVTARTRVVIVDHVVSGSALVLPIADIVRRCHARGVAVLIDGAHAPGALDLDLAAIDADWYTGNLHKWALAPRSCAILRCAPRWQGMLHPPVISWGLDSGFVDEFDWCGTRDPSSVLAAPAAIEFMRALGPDAMRAYQHSLAWDSAQRLAKRWQVELPMAEAQVGAMVTVPLPERAGRTSEDAFALRLALLEEDKIEIQLHAFRDRLWIRISAQVYVAPADIERLAAAIDRRIG